MSFLDDATTGSSFRQQNFADLQCEETGTSLLWIKAEEK